MERLNNLVGKEWVRLTKSVWCDNPRILPKDVNTALNVGVLISESLPRDSLKKDHPATFSEFYSRKAEQFSIREAIIELIRLVDDKGKKWDKCLIKIRQSPLNKLRGLSRIYKEEQ